jgi:hypothetical protein
MTQGVKSVNAAAVSREMTVARLRACQPAAAPVGDKLLVAL